jgi:hypothetical protein
MSISLVNEGQALLEWPASNLIFQLEETDALTSNAVWRAVAQTPVFVPPNYVLVNSAALCGPITSALGRTRRKAPR